MLSTSAGIQIQEILNRIAKGQKVTLEERIYINKYTSKNQNVLAWLRKASHTERNKLKPNTIDNLINGVDL